MKYQPSVYAEAFLEADGEKLSRGSVRNLLGVLRKYGDLYLLPAVLREIEKIHRAKHGIHKVEVVSARKIQKEVEPRLRERFGSKAAFYFEINPEVIGGIILRINDELVIDASIKRRIDKIFPK